MHVVSYTIPNGRTVTYRCRMFIEALHAARSYIRCGFHNVTIGKDN